MLTFASIDRIVHKFDFVSNLVDMIVSKIAPTTLVAASCPSGWYQKTTSIIKQCWADCNGVQNRCVKKTTYTYRYINAPYACQETLYLCLSIMCPNGWDSECN